MRKGTTMGHSGWTWVVVVCGVFAGQQAASAGQVEARIVDNEVVVRVDDREFTRYRFGEDLKYPYFHPVNGPATGKSLTTAGTEPYPHHRSLFFGCDRVNGGNFWQEGNERGQIVSKGPMLLEDSGERVVFTDECYWRVPGEEAVIRDRRRIEIRAPGESLRVIDFEIMLEPLTDLRIEKTNHSLFSARMTPDLSVDQGGTLVNAEGKRGEDGTWGVESAWCDYSGARDGAVEGLAILQHPENRWYPAKWFTRNYGFFSPTPMYWPEGDATELAKGEMLRLRYRVVAHAGDAEQAGIAAQFADYAGRTAQSTTE